MEKSKQRSSHTYWYFGGIATATASTFTHPMDVVRSHMQGKLKHIPASEVVRLIIKYRGFSGLYYGLSSSVIRQFWFSVQRFGIYEVARQQGLAGSFWQKVGYAAAAGLIAGFTNAPLEKVNIQMRMDAIRSPETRRNYQGYRDGFRQLYMKGGARNIFSGATLSALRGMVLTVGQLAIYHQIKDKFSDNPGLTENWKTFFYASLVAGGIATFITLPLDVINTIGKNAEFKEFRSDWHIVQSIFRENGFKGFYKGCTLSMLRFVPQTMMTFFFYEELLMRYGQQG